jgi:predicted small secreted protein
MCISKCLSYCYNRYNNKNDKNDKNYNNNHNSHNNFNFFKNIDGKEDKWIKFSKKEGCCTKCYKFSYLLAIQDIKLNEAICYRCFIDYTD